MSFVLQPWQLLLFMFAGWMNEVDQVDPILWTKKGHSLATLLPAFLTDNS
jgi:hypothetical protein